MTRFIVLTSGWDMDAWNLFRQLLWNIQTGYVPNSCLVTLFSSREKGESRYNDAIVDGAQGTGVPVITFSSKKFNPNLRDENPEVWRTAYHQEILNRLPSADFIFTLGYMLIMKLTDFFCPIVNLHPALPRGPQGTYIDVIWQLIREKAEATGAMMHLMTDVLDDASDVIAFDSFPIAGNGFDPLWKELEDRLSEIAPTERLNVFDQIQKSSRKTHPLWKAIRKKGAARELPLIIETARLLGSQEIFIRNGQVYHSDETHLASGFDLTEAINRKMKGV